MGSPKKKVMTPYTAKEKAEKKEIRMSWVAFGTFSSSSSSSYFFDGTFGTS